MSYRITDLPERVGSKIEPSPDGCWLWTGAARNQNGYGGVNWDGRFRLAHRVVYELLVDQIPKGLVIDHLCRVRACVNPAHLEPVTIEENHRRALRAVGDGVHAGAKTHCKRGHPFDDENTYVRPTGFRVCRQCARETLRKWRAEKGEE